jgi:hypothetical protein
MALSCDGSIVVYEWTSSIDGVLSNSSSFDSSTLSVGVHVVTFKVTDNDGATGSAELTIRVNDPPTASITSPLNGSVYTFGDILSFIASGLDTDGSIVLFEWTSNIDGVLSNSSSFDTSDLSAGTHIITFTVTDNDGATGSAQVTIRINNLPTASIILPTDGSVFNPGIGVSFLGTGSDDDGTITSYSWTSSLDGFIGSNTSFVSSTLSVGVHVVTFMVTDNDGATGSAQVTIRINNLPTASITSPSDGSIYSQRDTTTFNGIATDSDGTIASYEWTSSIDGVLSNSDSFSSSSLSVGMHTIVLTVTDNDGGISSEQVSINQTGYNVIWISPSEEEEFKAGRNMPIKLSVYDPASGGAFVVDESVVVRVYDPDMIEIFNAKYGIKSKDVRIDISTSQYITNYRIPKDAMGTYTITAEFASNRPNTEFKTNFKLPITVTAVMYKLINTINSVLN